MSVTLSCTDLPVRTAPARPGSDDHRLAELLARTGLERDLGRRYVADPLSVLDEFGLTGLCAAEPLYTGAELVIEDLGHTAPFAGGTFGCWTSPDHRPHRPAPDTVPAPAPGEGTEAPAKAASAI
jgi:hypothetical protein